jgi:hypothetical protein
MDPKQPAGAGDSIDTAAADKAIDEHNMTDMKLVLMDSADLASRSANMAADAGIELRLASKKLVDAHVQQRRLQFFLVFLCGCLMVVACGVFGAMAWRLQSRVEQLDSMMLAIGKRVVGMDASMESVGSVQQALQELMVKQEASAALQTKIDARLEEVIKTSQATPDLLVKQLDGKTQSMSKQVQAMDGRLQAQANALKTLSGQMKGLEGALGDASAVRRDMEKQQKELRDRQAADARAAKLAADRNRDRDRMLQYPRAPGTD